MCLVQGHNAVPPVRLESATLRSRVKHSKTEPLRSNKFTFSRHLRKIVCASNEGSGETALDHGGRVLDL